MMPAASSAHDHATEFYRAGAVPALRKIAEVALPAEDSSESGTGDEVSEDQREVLIPELAPAVLSATRVLAVNDEIVQSLVAAGTLDVARRALQIGAGDCTQSDAGAEEKSSVVPGPPNDSEARAEILKRKRIEALTASALGLVRNLCGNDEIKTTLCLGDSSTTSALPSILGAVRHFRSRASVQEHGLGTLAAMALRRPGNALRIVEAGGARDMLTAMRQHPSVVPVQRQGALAVRNVASRLVGRDCDASVGADNGSGGIAAAAPDSAGVVDVCENFLDLGAESVLRDIAGKHQGSVDEAYAALRDLGCSVSMVKIDADALATGNASAAPSRTIMFGEVKPKFNPVFEESKELGAGGMEGRIASHAGC